MSNQYLKPPARFSHGLTLVVAIGTALAVGGAIGQLPTLALGFVTLGLFLGAFWAYSTGSVPLTMVGTIAVVFAALALLVTPIVALAVAAGTATTVVDLLLRFLVPVLLLGGVGAIAFDLVPEAVTDQDGPALVGLLYACGISTGVFVGVAAAQFGLATVFGTTLSTSVDLGRQAGLELLRYDPITRVGGFLLLVGWVLWYGQRVAGLPLIERSLRRTGRRIHAALGDRLDRRLRGEDATEPRGSARGEQTDSPTSAALRLTSIASRMEAVDWSRVANVLGAVSFWAGFVLVVAGHTPDVRAVAGYDAARLLAGGTLGPVLDRHLLLAWLGLGVVGIRLAHGLGWRVVHLDWSTHQRRLAYLNGGVLVLLVGAAIGGPVFEGWLATPALQLMPVGSSGPLLVASDGGITFVPPERGLVQLEPRPSAFEPVLRNFATVVSVPLLGIGFLAVLLDLSFVLLIVVGLGAPSSGLSKPTAGLGQLFTAVVGASILGIGPVLSFGGAVATLVAADTRSLAEGVGEQLAAAAPTLRGEIVHVSANALIVIIVVVAMRGAVELVRVIPAPQAQWQLFGALWFALLAALLSFLVLGLRSDG